MDISKYTDYFHDGYVNKISHANNVFSISLESSVIENINHLSEAVSLSKTNTLKGTLKLYNIKRFNVGGNRFDGIFHMEYDDGDILDFEIINKSVFFLIEWKNFPPNNSKTDVSKIEIEAERIEWIPEVSPKI